MTWPIEYGPHDWAEDASHENGNYNNVCVHCNHVFIGHKRRVCCKVCHRPAVLVTAPSATGKTTVLIDSLLGKIEEVQAYRDVPRVVEDKLHDLLSDYDGEEFVSLAQKRERSFLKDVIVVTGAPVKLGPGTITFFRDGKVVDGPYRVEAFEIGTSVSDRMPEKTSGLGDFTMTFGAPLVSEVHDLKKFNPKRAPKDKAQWKRERSGRR